MEYPTDISYDNSVYNIALGITYDGSQYSGWQRQPSAPSIQESLEEALSKIANESITVCCAGRTDAGVHATGQVVNLKTNIKRKDSTWIMGVNTYMPKNIAVSWMKYVKKDFHARFSATARRYRYIIYNNCCRHAIFYNGLTHFSNHLDIACIERAGQSLLGENDFTTFRASQCQSCTPWRKLVHLKVTRIGEYVIIDIKANSFLHHMARNIIGSLMEIGCGNKPEIWMSELLAQKNRKLAAATAKAAGLYLVSVDYPEHFNIPKNKMGPLFLAD
ncbi:tRNA pseudouridine(38-40) synthase TruA [Candidatus Profftia lariciata]|uniref:tRNA pseudouridine(38-40) synthase TruA n=1 Tax=Candidatus Profftia lariciata TaxID=1987921 RepID=UPI001D02C114|nr:tRNA pseudouridine(38-40) synthase TruA [Candidatus Profftia lariciata]